METKLTKSLMKATYIMVLSVLLSLIFGNIVEDMYMGLKLSYLAVNVALFYLEEVSKERAYKYQLENKKLDEESNDLDMEMAKLKGWEEGFNAREGNE